MFYNQSSIPASENEFFVYWKQYFFVASFFPLMENICEKGAIQIFKTNKFPAIGH